jgi:hypothetical protein
VNKKFWKELISNFLLIQRQHRKWKKYVPTIISKKVTIKTQGKQTA